MTNHSSALALRLASALAAAPAPVPVVTGSCGAGRTSVLLHLRDLIGSRACQYVDVERIATTPERFLSALVGESPFRGGPHTSPANGKGPREAFDRCLAFLSSACTPEGTPATFLLDEVLDLRTFESFPGLRTVVPDLVGALAATPNRFVFATRFARRASRIANGAQGRLALHPLPAMSVGEVRAALESTPHLLGPQNSDDELARTVHALTDGRPCYVHALLEEMSTMADHGATDPVGALVALLSADGSIATRCRFSYELRLHRARGYGALKAILQVLAAEEPLTLTSISQRLSRTPGSTKDYLGWLEDVDLIVSERKQYRVTDPLLRLWIRLQARTAPPSEATIVCEVQRYAMIRLATTARADAALEPAVATTPPRVEAVAGRQRSSGIVEFD
jgi:hypothetical protein